MIMLIFVACMASDASQCAVISAVSPMHTVSQCTARAKDDLSALEASHPGIKVTDWQCVAAGRDA